VWELQVLWVGWVIRASGENGRWFSFRFRYYAPGSFVSRAVAFVGTWQVFILPFMPSPGLIGSVERGLRLLYIACILGYKKCMLIKSYQVNTIVLA
jgi:hypothetical protein